MRLVSKKEFANPSSYFSRAVKDGKFSPDFLEKMNARIKLSYCADKENAIFYRVPFVAKPNDYPYFFFGEKI